MENAGLFSEGALNPTEAEIYVSLDGVAFEKAGRVSADGNARAWYDVPLPPTPARYVKLAVTRPGKDGKIRVASLQVFADASSTGKP